MTLANPTKKNYSFSGWYANGVKVKNISSADYPAVTLVAKWKAKKFKISYELDGGKNNSANVSSRALAKGAFTLKDPTRKGYTFQGWYTSADFAEDSKVTSVTGKSNETVTVYAKWKAKSYKIAYTLAKGTMPDSYATSYKTSKRVQLPLPERKGYAFLGWYDNKECSGTPTFVLKKGTYGNKALYGKWSNKYQNAVVTIAQTKAYAAAVQDSAVAATFKKGDALCISKLSRDGLWGKVYKVGWINLYDTSLKPDKGV